MLSFVVLPLRPLPTALQIGRFRLPPRSASPEGPRPRSSRSQRRSSDDPRACECSSFALNGPGVSLIAHLEERLISEALCDLRSMILCSSCSLLIGCHWHLLLAFERSLEVVRGEVSLG